MPAARSFSDFSRNLSRLCHYRNQLFKNFSKLLIDSRFLRRFSRNIRVLLSNSASRKSKSISFCSFWRCLKSEEYVTSLRDLGWLIFVNAKQHILQNRTELVESVYMLTTVLSFVLYNLPAKVKVTSWENKNRNISTNKLSLQELNDLYRRNGQQGQAWGGPGINWRAAEVPY